MSLRLSKEFVIKYDDEIVARCTDFSLEINRSTIDLSSLDSGSWREIMSDQREWRISFNALIAKEGSTNYDALLQDIKKNDDAVTVAMGE
ncbi:MAG: phage tail tube protein, partial [bacterium]